MSAAIRAELKEAERRLSDRCAASWALSGADLEPFRYAVAEFRGNHGHRRIDRQTVEIAAVIEDEQPLSVRTGRHADIIAGDSQRLAAVEHGACRRIDGPNGAVEGAGRSADVTVSESDVRVRFHRRAHLPIISASGIMDSPVNVPWWNHRTLRMTA